jgi:hypothetical protein
MPFYKSIGFGVMFVYAQAARPVLSQNQHILNQKQICIMKLKIFQSTCYYIIFVQVDSNVSHQTKRAAKTGN